MFILSIVLVTTILLIACPSYFEPVLFLLTIGVAVLLNQGTNIILGETSDVTASISAILQLALSMDYSIILMNRYRQELQADPDREAAMTRALAAAFGSITGSSVTTIVGLLMLVFMRFKIGMDLGIVLAKGVLCSLLCVFTVLPGLILWADKLIRRTTKKPRACSARIRRSSASCQTPPAPWGRALCSTARTGMSRKPISRHFGRSWRMRALSTPFPRG